MKKPSSSTPKMAKQSAIKNVPYWFHSIDVGDGVITPGKASHEFLTDMWKRARVPDLSDKSVLDVGAWDGFYSFEAEKRGARRVVALDKFVWASRIGQDSKTVERMRLAGNVDNKLIPQFTDPSLPTKAGFDTVHRILESTVEQYIDDLMTVEILNLGMFDIVFYLGGLYHMSDPLGALRRLSAVTRELAIVETAGIDTPSSDAALIEFHPLRSLNSDPSNWFSPNPAALIAMLESAGFRRAEIISSSKRSDMDGYNRNRLIAHAWK